MNIEHHFETTTGDELTVYDLMNSSYRIVETMVDIDLATPTTKREPTTVFTHRIELHSTDDQIIASMRVPTELEDGGPGSNVEGG